MQYATFSLICQENHQNIRFIFPNMEILSIASAAKLCFNKTSGFAFAGHGQSRQKEEFHMERFHYHFEPAHGWMNDPNGLCWFKGKYHAFFQHYPYAPQWGQMHWGHAVSEDLLHWTELPIALYPDQPYEDDGGCFSGSAIVKDGRLWLFYTSVSHSLNQTQSVAWSDDGITFHKWKDNPVIPAPPADGSKDFRDPKVFLYQGKYYMVCGSGKDGVGKILLFSSETLTNWEYVGILYESREDGEVLECPDLFPIGNDGGFILMFSRMHRKTHTTAFWYGKFDGKRFLPISLHTPEVGPEFYAPQTFLAPDGRRILIGWMYHWGKELAQGADFAGALSLPRELRWENGKLLCVPVREAKPYLTASDPTVRRTGNSLSIDIGHGETIECPVPVHLLQIFPDTKSAEIFVNGGELVYSVWRE